VSGLIVAATAAVAALLAGSGSVALAAMVFGFIVLPLVGTFRCPPGWARRAMAVVTAATAAAGLGVLLAPAAVGAALFGVAVALIVVGTWLGRWLANAAEKRAAAAESHPDRNV
jgi:hypothetical protein